MPPSPRAIIRANTSANSSPKMEAMLLTTALVERRELRKSVHFSQISVRRWFKLVRAGLYFELSTCISESAKRTTENSPALQCWETDAARTYSVKRTADRLLANLVDFSIARFTG